MLKEQLEKYRMIGGWFLLFTLFSFYSLIKCIPGIAETTTIASQYPLYSKKMNFFTLTIIILILNFGFLLFRCLGIIKRKRNWIVISLIAIPISMLVLVVSATSMSIGRDSAVLDILGNLVGAIFWVCYLYISKRTEIYFMPQEKYDTLLVNAPTMNDVIQYSKNQNK